MARIAYYASRIPGKETWSQTDEGYRTYANVPVARTGSQEYFGRELKGNKGYDSMWGLDDNTLYEVWRPLEEVTSPETIASFETKSVLDGHPADKVLVDALDEYEGISKGHAQNIRVGPVLSDGETSLIADLHIKHPDLNVKVDNGIREISCGYTFLLAKDEAGRLIMTKIRGNHIAVVPRGRAGPEVAIGDAAPPETQIAETRKATMSFSSKFFTAIGFQSWAKDAKPEEVADALEEMKKDEAKDDDEHPKGCRCDDCWPGTKDKKKGAKDKAAKDDDGDDEEMMSDKKMADKKMADKAAKDAEEKDKEEKAAKDAEEEMMAKDEAEIIPADKLSKSEFSVGDALAELDTLRVTVAKSKDKGAIKAYNALTEKMRKVRDGVKDGALEDPFVSLVHVGNGVNDAQGEPDIMDFFNGRSYSEGLKAYNEFLASKGAK